MVPHVVCHHSRINQNGKLQTEYNTIPYNKNSDHTDSCKSDNMHHRVDFESAHEPFAVVFTVMCIYSVSCSLTALSSLSGRSPLYRPLLCSCHLWMDPGHAVLLPVWPFRSWVQTRRLPPANCTERSSWTWPQAFDNRSQRLCYECTFLNRQTRATTSECSSKPTDLLPRCL